MRELNRLQTIQAVIDKEMKPGVAAARIGLTTRQLRRLVLRYTCDRPMGLVSRHRGRPSNRQLPSDIEAQAIALIREHYADFGPTLAAEKLSEKHGIHLAKETVRRIMMTAGLWIPRKLRPPKVYQPRHRRACVGELIQIDGCEHHWFEDRAPACTLLVYVDDATSRLMHLHFALSESTSSYFEATRAYIESHGKPIAFYSDKASVFRVNHKQAHNGSGHTQFARAHMLDAHRPTRENENLDLISTWREQRCVSNNLTIQYDKRLFLLRDTPAVRNLAGRYIEVYHYPDNRIEVRSQGVSLPYTLFDRLADVDETAIVDNKRLGHALQLAKILQEKRDDRRSQSLPAIDGIPRRRGRPPGKKSAREINEQDLQQALNQQHIM